MLLLVRAMSFYGIAVAAARDRCVALLLRAAAARLGQPVPRLAAEQVARPALLQPYRDAAQAVQQGVGARRTTPRRCSAPRPTSSSAAWCWPAAIIPTLSTDLPLAPAADAIALVGLFALARVFISLAAMDIGTAFGTLGARREMLIGFLAEPALLMVLFTRLADLAVDLAHHHRRDAGAPRARDLPEPGLRRRRLHDGARWPRTRACRSTTRRRTSS